MNSKATVDIQKIVARANLRAVSDALQQCDRLGAEQDEPEGSRYVQLSDTLALELALMIRQAAATLC